MIRQVQITANACTCDVCGYPWISTAAQPPLFCQNRQCRSREWNGKRRAKAQVIQLPAPRKAGRPKSIALVEREH